MQKDIFINSSLIRFGKKSFICQYDHKSINVLESFTGKGFYKLYSGFLYDGNLSQNDIINIFAVSVYKNHGISAMFQLKNILKKNSKINIDEYAAFKLAFKNLLPDMQKLEKNLLYLNDKFKPAKHSSDYYDFEDSYALARKYLDWSDNDFWASSPRQFSFAMIATAKYQKEKEKFLKKQLTFESIDLLKGIKNIL